MMRFAFGISYDGSTYHGWQRQEKLLTIQAVLEQAIARVANHAVTVTCAGRTDKGVHAVNQVIHFDTLAIRSKRAWQLGTNSFLPENIRVNWVMPTTIEFNARSCAIARCYRYLILNQSTASALRPKQLTWYPVLLNEKKMQIASQCLLGEHDFNAFRGSHCQAHSTVRTIQKLTITRSGPLICIEVIANAFLQHMVRIIVGSLLEIGLGIRDPAWLHTVLLAKDRKLAGVTAKPHGLYLYDVVYPKPWQFSALSANFSYENIAHLYY
jgi:tRNA pseudouridine38-40 synthase